MCPFFYMYNLNKCFLPSINTHNGASCGQVQPVRVRDRRVCIRSFQLVIMFVVHRPHPFLENVKLETHGENAHIKILK